jgi:hypothetical protein
MLATPASSNLVPMPSALTHAFVGASLAWLPPSLSGRGSLAALLATLAVLPDLDIVAFAIGIA